MIPGSANKLVTPLCSTRSFFIFAHTNLFFLLAKKHLPEQTTANPELA